MDDEQKKPELKALCMRCRDANNKPTMQTMTDIQVEEKEGKGGSKRYSAKGKCAKCGGNMFKFLSKELADELRA
ncbi:hypothetical protein L0Y40_00470 [Candidatus Wolfebacteria bacterium]|nr:hypothetical protein [Candidatus Wolfebacteria bacterium]